MISAINSYGQNKVKVQKQNFGHVPAEVSGSCSRALIYLQDVQRIPSRFEKGKDEAILKAKIKEAMQNDELGAAHHLKNLAKLVGVSLQ